MNERKKIGEIKNDFVLSPAKPRVGFGWQLPSTVITERSGVTNRPCEICVVLNDISNRLVHDS